MKENLLNAIDNSSILTVSRCRHLTQQTRDCHCVYCTLHRSASGSAHDAEEERMDNFKFVEKMWKEGKCPRCITGKTFKSDFSPVSPCAQN